MLWRLMASTRHTVDTLIGVDRSGARWAFPREELLTPSPISRDRMGGAGFNAARPFGDRCWASGGRQGLTVGPARVTGWFPG